MRYGCFPLWASYRHLVQRVERAETVWPGLERLRVDLQELLISYPERVARVSVSRRGRRIVGEDEGGDVFRASFLTAPISLPQRLGRVVILQKAQPTHQQTFSVLRPPCERLPCRSER